MKRFVVKVVSNIPEDMEENFTFHEKSEAIPKGLNLSCHSIIYWSYHRLKTKKWFFLHRTDIVSLTALFQNK